MRQATPRKQGTYTRWMLLILLTVSLLLAIDYGQRAMTMVRVRQERERLMQELEQLQAERRYLEARKAYVESDLFVEQWARSEGMIRPGDVPIVPLWQTREAP